MTLDSKIPGQNIVQKGSSTTQSNNPQLIKGKHTIYSSQTNLGAIQSSVPKVPAPRKDVLKDGFSPRQSQIISEIKTMGQLTIRDLIGKIEGCSEKTIQRELLSLVEVGVLKKEGERRWSRYSMV
jgi:predicted HTH transcriptional regulator